MAYILNWTRFGDYYIDGINVIPKVERLDSYNPGELKNLPTFLAQVIRPKRKERKEDSLKRQQDRVVSFLKSYGFLGQNWDKDYSLIINGHYYIHEEINWIINHAYYVDLCLRIQFYLREVDQDEQLIKILDTLSTKQGDLGFTRIPTNKGYCDEIINFDGYQQKPLLVGQMFIEKVLNNNLGDAGRVIKNGESFFHLKSLIQLIYWFIADNFTGEKIRFCIECGTPFYARHESQIFCPHPSGGKKQSKCGRRHRDRLARHEMKGGENK